MYTLLNTLEEIELDNLEYGYLTDLIKHHSSYSFNIYVPKLMGAVGYGLTNSWSVPVNPKPMIINDTTCMPSVGGSLTMMNHINITRHTDTDFGGGQTIDPAGFLHFGQPFIVNFMNSDPTDYKLERVL